jgi:NADPH2:quinone reductase
MRAVVQHAIGGSDVLTIEEVPEPELELGSLLIQTTAVGVNFHDVEIRRRGEPGLQLPFIPGTDVVGRVLRVASEVTGFSPGDRVLALVDHGGYADVVRAHPRLTTHLPDEVPDELAAGTPVPGLTAWLLCDTMVSAQTRNVVVYAAAGGVGCWLGTLLRDAGVERIGLVSTVEKAEIARRNGYTTVLDRSRQPDLVEAVLGATRRRGADLILDAVAGPRFGDSFRMLRPGGTVVLYGRAAGPPAMDELMGTFLDARRNLGLHTFFLSRALLPRMGEVRGVLASLLDRLAKERPPFPVSTLPLTRARRAHELLESGVSVGKIVLVP